MSENLEWVSKAEAIEAAKLGGVIRERCGANREIFYDYKIHRFSDTERTVYLKTKNGSRWGRPFSTYIEDTDSDDSKNDRWAVIEIGTGKESPSVLEFFEELPAGSYVISSGATYMFIGFDYMSNSKGEERRHAILFYPYYGDLCYEPDSSENYWETTQYNDRNGATAEELRIAQRVANLSKRNNDLDRRVNEVSVKALHLEQDFKTLNTKINEYADNNRMCSEYEERIFGWNEDLQVMKLVGRERTWNVYVKVPSVSEYEVSIPVKARSAEEAKSIVSAMSTAEVLGKLADLGYKLNIEIEKLTETEPYMS